MKDLLLERKQNNIECRMLPSENNVIDLLIERGLELQPLYEELEGKLNKHQKQILLDQMLDVAVFRSPKRSRELRDALTEVDQINDQIAKCADKLAKLMARRDEICNRKSITCNRETSVVSLVKKAAEINRNIEFDLNVKETLENLSHRYDSKYWPTTNEVVEAIAVYAEGAEARLIDERDAEMIGSSNHSKSDTLRALLHAIEYVKSPKLPNPLPSNFQLSDNSLASFLNCALNLDADQLYTAEAIKQLRSRIRRS